MSSSYFLNSTCKYPLLSIFITFNAFLLFLALFLPDFISTASKLCELEIRIEAANVERWHFLTPSMKYLREMNDAITLDESGKFGSHIFTDGSKRNISSDASFFIQMNWQEKKISRNFCAIDSGCILQEARHILENDLELDWERVMEENENVVTSTTIGKNDVQCFVNYVRNSIETRKEHSQKIIAFSIVSTIGVACSIIVAVIIMILIWFFVWNGNSWRSIFPHQSNRAPLQIVPPRVTKNRNWSEKLRHARWFTIVYYSWAWCFFEGLGQFKNSLYNEYKLIFDERNTMIIFPSYEPYVNALRLTARHIREELLAYERMDMSRLVFQPGYITPFLVSSSLTLISGAVLILSLALRWNIFFAMMIYIAELGFLSLYLLIRLATCRLILTDQRIAVVSWVPLRGCFLSQFWIRDIDAFHYNSHTSRLTLLKRCENQNSTPSLLQRLGFKSRQSFENLEQQAMPNHKRIALQLGANEAAVVREALINVIQEIESLEKTEDMEEYTTESGLSDHHDHIVDQFM